VIKEVTISVNKIIILLIQIPPRIEIITIALGRIPKSGGIPAIDKKLI
jgi:hypothetical protein